MRQGRGALRAFLDAEEPGPTLAVITARRRVGLSTLLADEARPRGALHLELPRAELPVHLEVLRTALRDRAPHRRSADGSLASLLDELLRWAGERGTSLLIDGFDRLVAADRTAPSVVAEVLRSWPTAPGSPPARLVLAGSSFGLMRPLTATGPLAAVVTLTLQLGPEDFRTAARWMPDPGDLVAAARVFAVIGGTVGYATGLVGNDLPGSVADVDRWIVQRVLSPAAAMHDEGALLLATDPSLEGNDTLLQHSIVRSIASGAGSAARIAQDVGRPVSNLTPVLRRLVDAGVVVRHDDPIRKQRPSYEPADPSVLFHHAVIEPHRSMLRAADLARVWREQLREVFQTRVRTVTVTAQARTWLERFASSSTLPGDRSHIGPSVLLGGDGSRRHGLVVAGEHAQPAQRRVTAIAEAAARERIGLAHLHGLVDARTRLGPRAADARLLLFGAVFDAAVAAEARTRGDVELIDLERLYRGD